MTSSYLELLIAAKDSLYSMEAQQCTTEKGQIYMKGNKISYLPVKGVIYTKLIKTTIFIYIENHPFSQTTIYPGLQKVKYFVKVCSASPIVPKFI